MIRSKLTGVLAASAVAVGVAAVPQVASAGPVPTVTICVGGTYASPTVIPAGTYGQLVVIGRCVPGPGTLTAQSLLVYQGAAFASFLSTSTVDVTGNVQLDSGSVFDIGCGTSPLDDATCPDNPDATTSDVIGGNLSATGVALLVVHFTTIEGNTKVVGGGGGLSCNNLPAVLPPTPPFIDFDYDSIGLNAAVIGLGTCWAGFSDSTIGGTMSYLYNAPGLPDGNFLGNNSIGGSLVCYGNFPAPHLSDILPTSNTVGGRTVGQCLGET